MRYSLFAIRNSRFGAPRAYYIHCQYGPARVTARAIATAAAAAADAVAVAVAVITIVVCREASG